MRNARRILTRVITTVVVVYVVLCAALFVFQRSLIYFPQPRSDAEGSTLLALGVGSGTVNVSAHAHDGPEAVIYFGGNAEDVSRDVPELAEAFPGKAIYALHYPGYGGSPGRPSEKAIFAAAAALFDRVHAEHTNVEVIGRSLGTGAAVWLASERPVARLVLVTPFDSLADAGAKQFPIFPVRLLALDKFDSGRYAPLVTAPTRIVVAESDEVVPRSSSERLRGRFREGVVSYVVVPGVGHNSISESDSYWDLLKGE